MAHRILEHGCYFINNLLGLIFRLAKYDIDNIILCYGLRKERVIYMVVFMIYKLELGSRLSIVKTSIIKMVT